MKVLNPNYVSPVTAYALSVKDTVAAYLLTNKASRTLEFDKIRQDFPAEAAKLTDGMLAEIFKELGLKVEG